MTLAVPAARTTLPPAALALLVFLTLGWGANWPIMKIVLTEVPIWTFRTFCTGAGAIGLLVLARLARQQIAVRRTQWLPLTLIAGFNITGWNLLALYGLQHLPSGRASILAFTMPLWAVILSLFVLHDRLTTRRAFGLALGLAGLALLIGADLAALQTAPTGALFMLAAAISWAIGTVLTKRFRIALEPAAFTGWQMLIGGLPLAIGALILEVPQLKPVSLGPALGIAYNMIVCFIFCYWAWNRIVALVPVAVSGLSTLMIPIVGVVSGMVVLGERPGWHEYAAMTLIVAALATVLLPAPARAAASPD